MENKHYWLRRNQLRIKNIVGLLLILLAAFGILYWENSGRERFTYTDAIVLTQNVSAGQQISSEMLGTVKINKEAAIKDAITDARELAGKSAVCYIPSGMQLPRKFFESKDLTPGNGKYVLQLPQDWLYAFPQTLRRGDRAYFYTIKSEAGNDSAVIQRDGPDPNSSDFDGITAVSSQSVFSARIAYVKDSGNREVVDTVAGRMDGSAVISRVEIITDDAGYEKLKTLYDAGYQFILMYD